MFEQWSLFVLAFMGFVFLGFLIYLLGNRKSVKEEMKFETYTCGEPFPKVSVSTENFYHAIKRALGVKDLRSYHSGKLSDYLMWIVIGTVIVVLLMVIWV
ncbi:MAG: hypothetical protein GTN38_00705 [Candidatus Aenigmarchaeota archaeon]|nr:hypothetical protein [Candidatus Aenigmarchaeota archaeon]NIP40106.1 hypothetical protein [Candidatus Aenigmarchaeota archaeon]NIQ18183.1 hypothetical protein [Candidatus Aenigmarchaeota archaeon]NIS72940.1 hypothetical protein [Candidatus Aenigmarchaeota archaeon]